MSYTRIRVIQINRSQVLVRVRDCHLDFPGSGRHCQLSNWWHRNVAEFFRNVVNMCKHHLISLHVSHFVVVERWTSHRRFRSGGWRTRLFLTEDFVRVAGGQGYYSLGIQRGRQ